MKTFQRILAVFLALVMSLSVIGVAAFATTVETTATIDTTKTGSITITKYEYEGNVADLPNGNGTANPSTIPSTAKTLDGVTFTLYQVKNAENTIAYYNGVSTETVTVDSFLSNGAIDSNKVIGQAKTAITADGGVATFSGLAVGMYVVVETAYPDKVTDPADPFLVSIPMTNPSNETEWMYDVHVYPKNNTSEGTVTLNKVDEDGNPLAGVTFQLKKEDADGVYQPVGDKVTTTDSGSLSFPNLTKGKYSLEETATLDGYILDKRPVYFEVTANNTITCTNDHGAAVELEGASTKVLTIKMYNDKPDVEKEITSGENTSGVGQNVKYKLTLEVPHNITALTTYTATDAPNGLDVDTSTITVKCEGTDVTNCYSVAENGDGFTISFTPNTMAAYAGKDIIIEYSATVLASAATNGTATNEVTLTYTDEIEANGEEGDTDEDKDDEDTLNYKIEITKYKDSVAANNVAGGVQFELYDSSKDIVKVTQTDVGNYVYSESGTVTTLITATDGTLKVSGLPAGTYYLKETKAPDGYNLLSNEIEITVNANTEGTGDNITYTAQNYSNDIINKTGFTLPQTGGIGTLMFILMGGVLIAGGICLIAVPNKKRSV